MQFYSDPSKLSLKMHTPLNENSPCVVPSEFQIIGIISNDQRIGCEYQIETNEVCSLNNIVQYCLCDSSLCMYPSNSLNICKESSQQNSILCVNPRIYCTQNSNLRFSSDYDSQANYEIKNSSCLGLMDLHTTNQNYTIKEQVGRFGEISKVIVCKNNSCTKEFMRMDDFILHNKVHMEARPYPCRYCPRAYTQKGNLLKHMRKHIQPDLNKRRLYICQFCQRGYTEKYNLKAKFHSHSFYYNYEYRFVGMHFKYHILLKF